MNVDKTIADLLLDIYEATALTPEEKNKPLQLIQTTNTSVLLWNFIHSSKYNSVFSFETFDKLRKRILILRLSQNYENT